jgi:1-deoxy-D-xylulose-5-phosphate reductoisomerase
MRTPIAYALSWPERLEAGVAPLDFTSLSSLTFEAPDLARFPCLGLAFDAIRHGGDAPAVLNAANEVAVDAFLNGRIAFTRIPELVRQALEEIDTSASADLDALLARDRETRAWVEGRLAS